MGFADKMIDLPGNERGKKNHAFEFCPDQVSGSSRWVMVEMLERRAELNYNLSHVPY